MGEMKKGSLSRQAGSLTEKWHFYIGITTEIWL